jgi:hypothetical protein
VLGSAEWSAKKSSGVWQGTHISGMTRHWPPFIALVITCVRLKDTEYQPQRLGELADAKISLDEFTAAVGHIAAALQRRGKNLRGSFGAEDERAILEELKANGYVPLVPAPQEFSFQHSSKVQRRELRQAKMQEKRLARLAGRGGEAAQPDTPAVPDTPEDPQSHKLPRKG